MFEGFQLPETSEVLGTFQDRLATSAMVSYSQNGEDVVLLRLFGDLSCGTYVEVGAAHPVMNSVTFSLYLRGWSGICVDAVDAYEDLHATLRPKDVRVAALVGTASEPVPFVVRENTNESTSNPELVRSYLSSSSNPRVTGLVPQTLNHIISRVPQFDHFDLLVLDVEGSELDVLRSLDFNRFRPKIVLCESVEPPVAWEGQGIPSNQRVSLANFLESYGYVELLFDGVNSFFVQNEDYEELKDVAYPASFYDDFIHWKVARLVSAVE